MDDLVVFDLVLSDLDEVALERALRRVGDLVDETSVGLGIRHDLQHLGVNFVQKLSNFDCLGELGR